MHRLTLTISLVLSLLLGSQVMAGETPKAYREVGKQFGIPGKLLYSIAQVESGRGLKGRREPTPWPWTLNIAGKGYYLDSRSQACKKLKQAIAAGHLVDAGLMQINWQYNGKRLFKKPCDALSPYANVKAGARILARERAESGNSLFKAIGTYHTGSEGNPARKRRAMKYRLLVAENYNRNH